jgi:hypothetical protein
MGVSPKVGFAAVGTAIATIIWTIVAVTSPGVFTDAAIASLTGATATVIAFLLGFAVRDPARGAAAA